MSIAFFYSFFAKKKTTGKFVLYKIQRFVDGIRMRTTVNVDAVIISRIDGSKYGAQYI